MAQKYCYERVATEIRAILPYADRHIGLFLGNLQEENKIDMMKT